MSMDYTRYPRPSFIIAGLPRSRTAWLANLMDYEGVTCRHEWAYNVPELDDWMQYNRHLRSSPTGIGGDSGTWFAMVPDLRRVFPSTPIVVIDTPLAASLESCRQVGLPVSEESLRRGQENLHDIPGALRVSRYDINDRLEEIHQFCTGKTYRSQIWKDRARVLVDTTVQAAPWVLGSVTRSGYRTHQLIMRLTDIED